ncbi:MAG TPA: hypothetical protein VGJ20_32075 [Xanthobacteraceae bacterium]|jgi:hypothetical protein
MNTTISTKLAALVMALSVNSLIIAAVGYLFEIQAHPQMSVIAFARHIATYSWFA